MNRIDWTRIKNDVNGNPRYVCHFLNLTTPEDAHLSITEKYRVAARRANRIGGRKYHNKSYGGGIVFQSYSLEETESAIRDLLAGENAKEGV
jgi:hypothetical protein